MKKIFLAYIAGASILLLAGCGNTGQIYQPPPPTPQPLTGPSQPPSPPQSGAGSDQAANNAKKLSDCLQEVDNLYKPRINQLQKQSDMEQKVINEQIQNRVAGLDTSVFYIAETHKTTMQALTTEEQQYNDAIIQCHYPYTQNQQTNQDSFQQQVPSQQNNQSSPQQQIQDNQNEQKHKMQEYDSCIRSYDNIMSDTYQNKLDEEAHCRALWLE